MSKKLKVGDVLVGTCKEDKSKKDLFVVQEGLDVEFEDSYFLVNLTRMAGWIPSIDEHLKESSARRVNQFQKGRTVKNLDDDVCYDCYKFKRVKRLSPKVLKALTRDREECNF